MPTVDNEKETTFWTFFTREVTTTVVRRLHITGTYIRLNPRMGGSPVLSVDERQGLCFDCDGLFIGRFLQGRSVPALPGKETW